MGIKKQSENRLLTLPIGICNTCKHFSGWTEHGQEFGDCDSNKMPEPLNEYYADKLGTPDFQCPFWELYKLSFCIFHRRWYEFECIECLNEYYAEEKRIRDRNRRY